MTKSKRKSEYRAVSDGDLRQPMGLTDFMHGLGVVMRLPQKRRPTPEPVAVATPEKPRKPRSPVVWTSLTLCSIIALGIVFSTIIPERNDPIPEQLTGRWNSVSPRYPGRALEFQEGALYMKRGAEDTDRVRLPIKQVRVTPRNGSQHIAIRYVEDGATLSLNLTLHDYGGLAVIELQNLPDVVWRKVTGAAPNASPESLLPPELRP
jgi:hypothetical protein